MVYFWQLYKSHGNKIYKIIGANILYLNKAEKNKQMFLRPFLKKKQMRQAFFYFPPKTDEATFFSSKTNEAPFFFAHLSIKMLVF